MSAKQLMMLFGGVSGEMKVNDIPLAAGVNLDELKKGDDDPLEVIVEIPASTSTRGWNYTKYALQSIVDKVNRSTLAGFKGHQKEQDVKNQFVNPATHWVGAKMEGESAFFRGIVDQSEVDLKRWIRSGRIKQVSIFGYPKLTTSNGETQVIDYDALSIDWTPLDRAGMKTSIIAMSGEMWDMEGNGPDIKKSGGGSVVTPEEVLQELSKMMKNKQITLPMIAGEMGLSAEQIAKEVDSNWLQGLATSNKQLEDVKAALGVSGEMNLVETAKAAAEAQMKQKEADFLSVVGEMITKKITSETVRKDIQDPNTHLGKLFSYHRNSHIQSTMDSNAIAGELDNFLADSVVKGIIDTYHTDSTPGIQSSNGKQGSSTGGLRTKRTRL